MYDYGIDINSVIEGGGWLICRVLDEIAWKKLKKIY